MATDEQLRTYADDGIVEDVLPAIEILTAKEGYLLNNLGKSTAVSTIHETQTDTLRTTASGAVAEGGDYTNLARTTPSRVVNLVEIVAIPYSVTRTQQQVNHYSGENELVRQTNKALMEWANAAEFDIMRSTLTSGASGTAPKMGGVIEMVSRATNHTSQTSGTTFVASILKGLLADVWENANGKVPTDIFMGGYLKSEFDTFTQGQTKYMNADDKRLVDAVNVYDSGGFGMLRAHTHRYIQQSTDATGRILALHMDDLKIAYLQRPFIDTGLARSGDYDSRAVVGKCTVETRNYDTHFYCDGFVKDATLQ